jgi:chemotaxis protein MotB
LMGNPLLIQKAKMRHTKDGLVISLSEAGFFAPGEAVIDAQADEVINTIAESVKTTSASIRIEGHTDSTPISNAKFPSNWELSTARAASVLVRLTEKGIAPERLSAAGYAGFQPVADNATPEGRAQNRRVDVVIIGR